MSEGLKAMNGMKAMCVEKGYTNLFRLLSSTIAETERLGHAGNKHISCNIE
jgi:hypothetical protein